MQKQVTVVTELFNIAVNDFGTKKFVHRGAFTVTVLGTKGIQCIRDCYERKTE